MKLEVSGLSFSYGSRKILQDVGFVLEGGDIMAILGPNGVGKTTLFRCILGFLHSYEGTVELDGRDVRTFSSKERSRMIAYIPQSSNQVFDFTLLELVLMGTASRVSPISTPGEEQEAKAYEALNELGIAHLADRGCEEVSGGEYQLALLARALVQEARILIMDEPTANLDYGNQFRMMERIAHLADRGLSIMLSAHDPNQVLRHATRVLMLDAGQVCSDGTPQDVMTEKALSQLYGISVRRVDTEDGQESVSLCYPHSSMESGADGCEGGREG